jgi:signal peptidase I
LVVFCTNLVQNYKVMSNSKAATRIIWDVVELLIIAIGIIAFSWFFLAEPLEVTGDSMSPTLLNGEQIVAEKLSMNFEDPTRGEIVVFESPDEGKLLIKRIVGLPNEKFMVQDGTIVINGTPMLEVYLDPYSTTSGKRGIQAGHEITVPANSYIVMGDNRDNSTDSRDFGPITLESIVGRAFMVYQPLEDMRIIRPTEQR